MATSGPSAARNSVASLGRYGQSAWLDFIRRCLITSGELERLVDEEGLGGETSYPAIFEKAIDGSDDYRGAIEEISRDPHLELKQVFELLAVKDIQDAADVPRHGVRRPCHGSDPRFASDPYWKDLVIFHEYFCGDTSGGRGRATRPAGPPSPCASSRTWPAGARPAAAARRDQRPWPAAPPHEGLSAMTH